MKEPVNVLLFSTLYPTAARPQHGIFVETRLRHLLASGQVRATVIAPVPWFPSTNPRFGDYAVFARSPHAEERHGINILHPRYPLIPKIGMSIAPWLLARAVKPLLARLLAAGEKFDLIDAHYFYPDGVAAMLLGQWFGKPVVITARGTDLNLVPQYFGPRRMIRWAASHASGMVTVCRALKDVLVELGVPDERVSVLRNGVDLKLFQPRERTGLRAKLNLHGRTLLSVGWLIERKGHHHVIQAMARLSDCTLLIAGEGPQRGQLEALARQLGVSDRVHFLGALPQSALAEYYGAVDALVLASSREGWANVLLEAMACGTPVVASNIWGTPEVVADPVAGVLMPELSAAGVVTGVERLFAHYPDSGATRRYAERFSWDATTDGQLSLFNSILTARPPA